MRKIYGLCDPRDGALRYIGVTKRTLAVRLAWHQYECSRQTNRSHRAKWVRALAKAGVLPAIVLLREVLPTEDWREAEIGAIADAKQRGAKLVNGTLGGEGVAGRVYKTSEATKDLLRKIGMGRRPSEETRARRSASLKQFYADPARMAARQEMARYAARSANGRSASAARMRAIWSDPVRAEAMRALMIGKKKRKRDATCHVLSGARKAEGPANL